MERSSSIARKTSQYAEDDAAEVLGTFVLGFFTFVVMFFVLLAFLRAVPGILALTAVASLGVFAVVVVQALSHRAQATPAGYGDQPPVLRMSLQPRRRRRRTRAASL
jgi:hypothetical protein